MFYSELNAKQTTTKGLFHIFILDYMYPSFNFWYFSVLEGLSAKASLGVVSNMISLNYVDWYAGLLDWNNVISLLTNTISESLKFAYHIN